MGLENQLFDWEGWDELDQNVMIFHKVELLVDLGDFKKGDKFSGAVFDVQESKLILQQELDKNSMQEHVFNLYVSAVFSETRKIDY